MAYHDRHGSFDGLTLVFGGKRPALFLKRELAQRLKKPFTPPKMLSMDEFIGGIFRETSAARPLNDLEAAFELFRIAQRDTPHILKGRESFARFRPWAREILGFIDQVDLEDVDDDALLNIQAQAEIGYDVPEAVNRLLSEVVRLRQALHQFLEMNQFSRRGWVYRQAARSAQAAASASAGEIWFCNFFYWHRTEESVIRHFVATGRARLFFQGDERRWPVLKAQAARMGLSIREGAEVIEPDYDLKLYRAGDGHAEAATVRHILESIPEHECSRTVIVVPEADRLVPLLSEIAPAAKAFNVSMGYPLKRSSLFTLMTHVFDAQLSRNGSSYYARDYLKVLQHPFIKNLSLGRDASAARILSHKIEEVLTGKITASLSGRLFFALKDVEALDEIYTSTLEMLGRLDTDVVRDDLKAMIGFIHRTFFSVWETIGNFAQCADALEAMIDALSEKSFMKDYPLNLPVARRMADLAAQWKQGAFSRETFDRDDIFHILQETVEGEMTAFTGTPLKGLQVLGLFETRSLNFDHVIVIDLNEGLLPRLQAADPLIPREVSRRLGISRLEIDEEIQRYQFLRLLSSAKTVHLVYQDNRERERSRFIEQLIWAREKREKRLKCVDIVQAGFTSKVSAAARCARKTPAMIEYLKRMTFSASGVNTYLRNPMEFYERRILGIRQEDDMLDEPEARHVGMFVHALLEEAFAPYLHKYPEIDGDFRKRFEELFEWRFEEMFAKSMKSDAFLLKTVMQERLKRFLDHEAGHDSRRIREIIALEQKFTQEIILPSCGAVKFVYVIDRIDRMQDGSIRALDYKTGGQDRMPAAAAGWKDRAWSREVLSECVRSFQIPLYHHYLRSAFPGETVDAALYNLRTLETKTFCASQKSADPQEIDQTFLKALDFILSEIFNPDVDFMEDVSR